MGYFQVEANYLAIADRYTNWLSVFHLNEHLNGHLNEHLNKHQNKHLNKTLNEHTCLKAGSES